MSTLNRRYSPGETFPIQFAWRLPDSGYLRAVFEAEVLDFVDAADKYIIQLRELLAGREETHSGEAKSVDDLSPAYWSLVGELTGRKLTVAYEADDGRALYLRLETLTGEHTYFSRFDLAEARIQSRQTEGPASSGEDPTP